MASSTPLAAVSQGRRRSGARDCVSHSTLPSTSTPVVCVAATVPPIASTWRPVPRRPTTAAAMRVLPWPGARLWKPPSTTAMPKASAPAATPSSRPPTMPDRAWVSASTPSSLRFVGGRAARCRDVAGPARAGLGVG